MVGSQDLLIQAPILFWNTYHVFGFSAKATDEYELARKKVASFINASDSRERMV